MMRITLIAFLLFCAHTLSAQSDIPATKPLDIKAEPDKEGTSKPVLSPPALPKKLPEYDLGLNTGRGEVRMLPDRDLKQAGHDLVLKPNLGESEKGKSDRHFGDMYLGDFKTSSKFVGIVCRDHEFVDGDRVRIFVNGEVVEHNILLTGAYKGLNLELDKGFNRLDFEALNQGSTGPNTAQVDVYDDTGKLIYSNKWLLSTGSKASLIIVKDE
ncbi:hypothetical protein OZ410_05670 [Robiginitalea sp. M366]|uniref:hypothetical protein n=1 Tax=Robiginitalea aestuariiviva TaxID=3036903 RepID=UPI00240DF9EC|nr:hypothetical protein [Robiginitalea aestuariiviva]MDG1571795.1 hypothetical protein [Robiginitalea aestuariiviva]